MSPPSREVSVETVLLSLERIVTVEVQLAVQATAVVMQLLASSRQTQSAIPAMKIAVQVVVNLLAMVQSAVLVLEHVTRKKFAVGLLLLLLQIIQHQMVCHS